MTRPSSFARSGSRPSAVRETLVVLVDAVRVEVALQRTRRRVPRRLRLSVPALCDRLGVRLSLAPATVTASTPPAPLPGWCEPRMRAVHRVTSRWPAGDTCLRRSLLLARRLADLAPVLRLGPTFTDDHELVGHAWLEVAGHPLGEPGIGPLARPA